MLITLARSPKEKLDVKQSSLDYSIPSGNINSGSAILGFEQKLWKTADKMRNNMDAAEYKHVVLGLIFLKYISDVTVNYSSARLLNGLSII